MADASEAVVIRAGRPDDAPQIAEFNCRLALETEHKSLDPATVAAGVSAVLAGGNRGRYYLACRMGAVLGQAMVTYEWSDWRNGWFWWLQSVYVVADARGQGVLRLLVEHIQQAAAAEPEVRGLRLYVERENAVAQRAYERLGMRPSGHLVYELDWS